MGYNDGEALVLTRVRACTGFDTSNTSRGDWKLLNSGRDDHYAILRPGAMSLEFISVGQYTITWQTLIEVWQRYTDEIESKSNLCTHVVNLFSTLAYPHLGSASIVQDAMIVNGDEPQVMVGKDGGPSWLRWTLQLRWTEEEVVTYAE